MNSLLDSAYNRAAWIDFLQNRLLPDDFKLKRQTVNITFKSKYIKPQAYWIGDCSSLDDLAIIEISHCSENDPRISVSRDAFRLMAELNLESALFFFVSENSDNYRFSLITLKLELEGTGVKYKFSNPKRFSFYLGPDAKTKTPELFLFQKGRISDLEDLQGRFSIEVVNKEFYQRIQKSFYSLVGGKLKQGNKEEEFQSQLKLPGNPDTKTRQEFGVRLIGRIVFCWFLKKKLSDKGNPLIPDDVLSSAAVKNSFYHHVMEPLFFEVLNTPLEQRHQDFRSPLYDAIPFLNGGLFDPNMHQDFYIPASPTKPAQPAWHLKIPDQWFKELFGILETYNFTIDENTSIDIDLSVDPEMLGRIFENLLAEINPETGQNAKNATGSFYTPRAIVEYMVDEALIQYLKSKTDIDESAIRDLLDFNIEECELPKHQKIAVIDALDEIKVLDPACGSGAFPIGMLQKMLLILQKVDPESIEWVVRQLNKIPNKLVRDALEEKLMDENWQYQHKMGIIKNAIYGVDIQTIATEITKLRLFLTLIVDDKVLDDKPNKNIHPLPNLSFKFVTANSLIPLGEKKETQLLYKKYIRKYDGIRDRYFHAHFVKEKESIKSDFAAVQKELVAKYFEPTFSQADILGEPEEKPLTIKKEKEYIFKLVEWNPFEDKVSSWFEPKWMFGIKEGFDIVIGNPPWIQSSVLPIEYKEQYKKLYVLAKGQYDIFCLFIEKSLSLLSKQGSIVFITPNRFITNIEYTSYRYFLLSSTTIKQVIDLGDGVFSDVNMPSAILICTNEDNRSNCLSFSLGINDKLKFKRQSDIISIENHVFPLFGDEMYTPVLAKINSMSVQLKDLLHNARGVEIGKKSSAISERMEPGSVPLLRGEDIDRYRIKKQVYLRTNIEGINYKSPQIYEGEKILIRKTGTGVAATIDYEFRYVLQVVYVFKLRNGIDCSHEFVLAILNSTLLGFWYHNTYGEKGRKTFPHLTQGKVKTFPIPKNYSSAKALFTSMVKEILSSTNEMDRMSLESQIDLMVYKLYELSYAEAKLIDPDLDKVLGTFGLSKAEFERMTMEQIAEIDVSGRPNVII
nr:adenine-specific DNA-methyltransferase [Candidatus Cloacimonadota bacterium]